MLEDRNYRAVDIVFLILYAFIDWVTGYTMSPKKTSGHAMYIDQYSYVR